MAKPGIIIAAFAVEKPKSDPSRSLKMTTETENLAWALREMIRGLKPAEGQDRWVIHGIGTFDLEGNPVDETTISSDFLPMKHRAPNREP
jgi:hypothetical protein